MFASVFGAGRYVVNQGDNLAATMGSANSITIGTGACFVDGRYFRVTVAETLTIDSGAQGVNRIDLVGVKYEYDNGTGIETGSLAVVKGTAVAGTPSAPTYTDGDILAGATEAFFPLYSIEITNITPATPTRLFKLMSHTVTCPWPVGAVLQMTNGTNPNDVYPGTTWAQIKGKFLLGSSSSHAIGTTGGAETVTLATGNLPAHTHTYSKSAANTGGTAITKAQLPSGITGEFTVGRMNNGDPQVAGASGVFSTGSSTTSLKESQDFGQTLEGTKVSFNLGGSGNTHTHTISTSSTSSGSTGSGTAVDKMPPYKVVNMWERTA